MPAAPGHDRIPIEIRQLRSRARGRRVHKLGHITARGGAGM